ncbi:MAG TPA: glycosyltransferase family 39 protein [Candidatus Sulfomarinibacteraceae bacterium]|nr:glycosyltransferase family 39 protein [Candidatus Sulfomarinibacteraceae bacterium]
MRTPVALFVLALLVRLALIALYPDAAYPDSYYYVDVARAIAAGHGLNVDFVWIFAEVGNRIPEPATLPIPSNAHWLPLASLVQVPFIALLGPSPIASALPLAIIGSLAAPLTWAIARDVGAQPLVATTAGVLSAIPAAATVFMAQPENFAIMHPLVAAAIWCTARGLKGDGRAYAVAGLLAGLASLGRNDGVFLGGAIGLVWVGDRIRWWRRRHGSGSWVHVDDRGPISVAAAAGCLGLFLLVMAPWWYRQLTVFGSISPTSSSGAALWILTINEWNSITANPSLGRFLDQGLGPILASRLDGLTSAIGNFVVVIGSVVLVPFMLIGAIGRIGSRDFTPWFVYTGVVFLTATLLYPLHVPGGAFIHSAIGLAPHAAILSIEGVLIIVGWIAARRRTWDEGNAGTVFAWGIVVLVAATAVVFGRPVQAAWDEARQPRIALAAELNSRSVPADDRLLSIDAAGMKYFTGRPGVVTPDDPIETIEAVARAYDTRWLVLERGDAARALAPVLLGESRPAWIGQPVFSVPSADGGAPRLALYPVCTTVSDDRCE